MFPERDPYSLGDGWDLTKFRLEMRLGFAVTDPRSLISPSGIPTSYRRTLTAVETAAWLCERKVRAFQLRGGWHELFWAVVWGFRAGWREHAR